MRKDTVRPIGAAAHRVPVWDFSDRVRKVRRESGMTQEEFADALTVGRQRYAAWEAGRNIPHDILAVARRLEKLTGVDKLWFLGWLEQPHEPDDGDLPTPRDGEGLPPMDSNHQPSDWLYPQTQEDELPFLAVA